MTKLDLSKLGFTENETAVYVSLFDLGKARAGQIIDLTSLHRNIVYTALDGLVERRLVTKTLVKGVAEFVANDPSHLVEEVEEKKVAAQHIAQLLKERQKEAPREITVYEGLDGLRKDRDKTLQYEKGDTLYVFGVSQGATQPEVERYWRRFHRKRAAKGINLKMLFEQDVDPEPVQWRNTLPNTEARYLPFQSATPFTVSAIGDRFSIYLFQGEPVVFTIKSSEIVEAFSGFFNYFWDHKVVALEGDAGFDNAFGDILKELGEGDELLVMGLFDVDDAFAKALGAFHKRRADKGIKTRFLLNSHARDVGDMLSKIDYTEVRYMQKSMETPAVFLMYGEKTIISLPNQRTFFRIENAEAAQAYVSYFNSLWDQKNKTLSGDLGIEELCELVLEQGEDLYLIGATGKILETHTEYYKTFTKRRVQKQIRLRMLANESLRDSEFTRLPLSEVSYLPRQFETPMVIWIFGEYVANVMWHDPQTVFLIHDKNTAEYYRQYYRGLKGGVRE